MPDKDDAEWYGSGVAKRLLVVYGPPGTGKSSAMWEWANRVRDTNKDCSVTWIDCSERKHVEEPDPVVAWRLTGQQIDAVVHSTDETVRDVYRSIIKLVNAKAVAVFDGLRSSSAFKWTDIMTFCP